MCLGTLLFYKNHCWKLCKIYKVGAEKQKHLWNMYKNVEEVYNDKWSLIWDDFDKIILK